MPIPAKVASTFARFTKAVDAVKPRIIGRSTGEYGTGKTFFWLTAPAPIVVLSFDKGLEGVVEQFQEVKPVYFKDFEWTPTDKLSKEEAVELRDEYCEAYENALQIARTVVIDKETDLWELFRYAQFGEPNDAPRNYPRLNQYMRKYINMPKALNVNVGFIQSMKDEWKTVSKVGRDGQVKDQGISTGNRVSQGFGELEGLVQINLHHRRQKVKNAEGVTASEFWIDIGKARCPGSSIIQDQSFQDIDFATLGQLAFPDSDEDSWT